MIQAFKYLKNNLTSKQRCLPFSVPVPVGAVDQELTWDTKLNRILRGIKPSTSTVIAGYGGGGKSRFMDLVYVLQPVRNEDFNVKILYYLNGYPTIFKQMELITQYIGLITANHYSVDCLLGREEQKIPDTAMKAAEAFASIVEQDVIFIEDKVSTSQIKEDILAASEDADQVIAIIANSQYIIKPSNTMSVEKDICNLLFWNRSSKKSTIVVDHLVDNSNRHTPVAIEPKASDYGMYADYADQCLTLFDPYRYAVARYNGVELKTMVDSTGENCFRSLNIHFNTGGRDMVNCSLIYIPRSGMFSYLPTEDSNTVEQIRQALAHK